MAFFRRMGRLTERRVAQERFPMTVTFMEHSVAFAGGRKPTLLDLVALQRQMESSANVRQATLRVENNTLVMGMLDGSERHIDILSIQSGQYDPQWTLFLSYPHKATGSHILDALEFASKADAKRVWRIIENAT
eukprot:scpid108113/ scgid28910/ 